MELLRYITRRKKSQFEIISLTNNGNYLYESVPRAIRWRVRKTDRMYLILDDCEFTDFVLLEMLKYLTSLSEGFCVVAVTNLSSNATLLAQFSDEIILAKPFIKGKAYSPHLLAYLRQKYNRYNFGEIGNSLALGLLANSRNITRVEKYNFGIADQHRYEQVDIMENDVSKPMNIDITKFFMVKNSKEESESDDDDPPDLVEESDNGDDSDDGDDEPPKLLEKDEKNHRRNSIVVVRPDYGE